MAKRATSTSELCQRNGCKSWKDQTSIVFKMENASKLPRTRLRSKIGRNFEIVSPRGWPRVCEFDESSAEQEAEQMRRTMAKGNRTNNKQICFILPTHTGAGMQHTVRKFMRQQVPCEMLRFEFSQPSIR